MAEFRIVGERKIGTLPLVVEKNFLLMNNKGNVRFCFAEVPVEIWVNRRLIKKYISRRGITISPDGVKILPYLMLNGCWQVVMVEQFRVALPGKTLEPPGGEADLDDPRLSMAKELEEETHIKINPADIELVYREWDQPATLAAKSWGGIVKINQSQLSTELIGGEWMFGEYTVVAVIPLAELLRERDALRLDCGVDASRLLDEVAKKVGLLVKNY